MKRWMLFIIVCAMLSACAPTKYYQMYQTKPTSGNSLAFEDDNCSIVYNFWEEYGDIGFLFTNKTSENIYLHLDECFFVKNGFAEDYFQNRVFNGVASAPSKSINYQQRVLNVIAAVSEKPVICIPAHASKIISEFKISTSLYESCDLKKYPGNKDANSLTFTEKTTPLTFGNRIAYSVGESERIIRISNDFYVSKISNLTSKQAIDIVDEMICGEKTLRKTRVVKDSGPDKFYIIYTNPGLMMH